MAASTSNRYDLQASKVAWLELPVAAATNIYEGTLVALNSAGYAVPLSETLGLVLAGMARAQADNSAGAAGAINVEVEPLQQLKYLELNASNPLQAWLGQLCYAIDDNTVALAAGTTTADILVGKIVGILKTGASGKVLVDVTNRTAG